MESGQPTRTKAILLVDEQDKDRITATWLLGNFGFVVESARTAEEALALFNAETHAVVITANPMTGMTGTEMAHVIKLRSPSTPIIMCAAVLPDDQTCLDVVVQRPVPLLALRAIIERMLHGLPHACQTPFVAASPCACSKGSLWAPI